ncbi:MAG TPA: NADP-dependent oxidoreductase [Magnetospirillaceae bacterium]|nr:NADP-dependent oxidoreductase [Magnetospirillaceae bacterium]
MKAAQITTYGGASVIHINEIPAPSPGPNDVLIKVHASSLNPADSGMREGALKDFMPISFPATLGGDVAGVVAAIGTNVQNFAPGDKVYGQAYGLFGASGAFAEYAVTDATKIGLMPRKVDFPMAASLVLVGVSATEAILHHIALQPGQKILIHGGAGSIGQLAIQLAKKMGAHVATTVSGKNVIFAEELGADEVFDYQTQDFSLALHDYDAVLDLASNTHSATGNNMLTRSLAVLKPGATLVSLVAYQGSEALQDAQAKGFNALFQQTNVTTAALDKLRTLVDSGTLKLKIARTFPLAEIQQAFVALETEHPGKIAIQVKA